MLRLLVLRAAFSGAHSARVFPWQPVASPVVVRPFRHHRQQLTGEKKSCCCCCCRQLSFSLETAAAGGWKKVGSLCVRARMCGVCVCVQNSWSDQEPRNSKSPYPDCCCYCCCSSSSSSGQGRVFPFPFHPLLQGAARGGAEGLLQLFNTSPSPPD